MNIKQFYDKPLAHASYALISEGQMAIVDPGRDPQQYYDYAKASQAEIVAVFETHPHADFVSSHLEIHKETGATIYVSRKVGADYPHQGFDEGEQLRIGHVEIKALNTPGHSPDSITIIATDPAKEEKVAFTGDTLFIGDVGRPDLREEAGKMRAKRESLAADMYESIHQKLLKLPDDTLIYPAHGAGSLCGKNMSIETYSTMGEQRATNWALQDMSLEVFMKSLLEDQPFVPKYFGYDVDLNKAGAPNFKEGVHGVNQLASWQEIPQHSLVIDARNEAEFKAGHLEGAINIMHTENGKFETWIGSLIGPDEKFFIIAADKQQADAVIERTAKIGYELLIAGVAIATDDMPTTASKVNMEKFANNRGEFTIVDVRNEAEASNGKYFQNAIVIPLHELRERAGDIPTDKPIVVHCAAGFRSAAGSSVLMRSYPSAEVLDLGEAIKDFETPEPVRA